MSNESDRAYNRQITNTLHAEHWKRVDVLRRLVGAMTDDEYNKMLSFAHAMGDKPMADDLQKYRVMAVKR